LLVVAITVLATAQSFVPLDTVWATISQQLGLH
jgi:hypothetical protein